jgi:hypothetical protein
MLAEGAPFIFLPASRSRPYNRYIRHHCREIGALPTARSAGRYCLIGLPDGLTSAFSVGGRAIDSQW